MAFSGYLSIGEFSKLTGIPRSKLIYYDEIGLFPAAKRGANNYRYYSLNQVTTVGFINDMSSFGIPLKSLLPLAKKRSPEALLDVLEDASEKHQKKIAELKDTQDIMGVFITMISQGIEASDAEFEVLEYEPHNIILGNENIHQDAQTFFPAWLTFVNAAKKAGLNTKYPIGGYFDDMDRFIANPNMPSRFYFINPRGKDRRGGGKWLAGYVRGYYGDVGDLPQRMISYAEEQGLELVGPIYNSFLLDEMSLSDPEKYLLRVSVKIKEDE